LGMAIAKSIITQKHGGKITCTSQLSKGHEVGAFLMFSYGNGRYFIGFQYPIAIATEL